MRKLTNYARSFAENLDARKAYRFASGLCAAAALTLALDASCVEDKYTQPKDTRTDIEVVMDTLDLGTQIFYLPHGRNLWICDSTPLNGSMRIASRGGNTKHSPRKGPVNLDITGLDTKLKDNSWRYEQDYEHVYERFTFYPAEKSFEPINPFKNSPDGPMLLTEEEVEEVKVEYRQVFSDIAKSIRRNREIERRLREDVLRTGEVERSHKEPIFDYSWMPGWLFNMFSRTVVTSMEKEYDTGNTHTRVSVNTHSNTLTVSSDNFANTDLDGDGYFDSGGANLAIPDELARLVGMEDEK
ncbi:MAG TPA: hypothetical protein VJA47_01405 [archaeon]|nr:hypothetical protein [archaeon]